MTPKSDKDIKSTTPKSAPATAPTEYLAQLERLVLELNLELGRRDNQLQPVDPIEQLQQRILDLNLENLALREHLGTSHSQRQSTSSHSTRT